jgi:PAS domain S-box-containing protein
MGVQMDQSNVPECPEYECIMMKKIISLIPIGIYYVHSRKFVWANDFIINILGYTREELIGKSTKIIYKSEEEFNRVGKALYAEKSGVITDVVRKDGSHIQVMMHALSEEKTDGDVFLFPHVIIVSILSGYMTNLLSKSEEIKNENAARA